MPWYIYSLVFLELTFVAWIDFKTSIISNYWFLVNILAFVLFSIFLPDVYVFGIKNFFLPLAFIFVGYMLFTLNIMGAGDSKYLFSLFILIPYESQDYMLYTLIYSTVVVGGMSFFINIYQNTQKLKLAFENKNVELIKGIFGKKFTYAPVILLSWIWFGYLVRVWE
jgi:prepilin peptidase CpaA